MTDKNNTHFLSLIVPAYRQEKTIIENIKHLQFVTKNIRYDHEIIVVVDGMVDKTFDMVKAAKLDKVGCIAYEQNQGKAFAIRVGMNKAKGDYIMFIDSGMEIDPNGISMLLEHMEWYNADIIVGSKRHPASHIVYSPVRKFLSYGYYLFVRLLFGLNIHDTQAGIKVFRKSVLEKVLPRLLEKKFAGDLEMLVVSRILGFRRIFEAPIKLDYNLGKITSAATIKSIWGILHDTLAIYYRTYILRSYYKSQTKLPSSDEFPLFTC